MTVQIKGLFPDIVALSKRLNTQDTEGDLHPCFDIQPYVLTQLTGTFGCNLIPRQVSNFLLRFFLELIWLCQIMLCHFTPII